MGVVSLYFYLTKLWHTDIYVVVFFLFKRIPQMSQLALILDSEIKELVDGKKISFILAAVMKM